MQWLSQYCDQLVVEFHQQHAQNDWVLRRGCSLQLELLYGPPFDGLNSQQLRQCVSGDVELVNAFPVKKCNSGINYSLSNLKPLFATTVLPCSGIADIQL